MIYYLCFDFSHKENYRPGLGDSVLVLLLTRLSVGMPVSVINKWQPSLMLFDGDPKKIHLLVKAHSPVYSCPWPQW